MGGGITVRRQERREGSKIGLGSVRADIAHEGETRWGADSEIIGGAASRGEKRSRAERGGGCGGSEAAGEYIGVRAVEGERQYIAIIGVRKGNCREHERYIQ